MFTIEVSITKDDLPSYSREIDSEEVSVPNLYDAASVLNRIRIEMKHLRTQFPEPDRELDRLQAAKDAVSELSKKEQDAFDAWMRE